MPSHFLKKQVPVVCAEPEDAISFWITTVWTVIMAGESVHQTYFWPHTLTIHNEQGVYVEANCASQQDNASYVRFVHAALGYPAPTTFLKAVTNGYITGPSQFPRLTPKMVRKYMPNTIATARGHLDKTRAKPPHDKSEAVSALQRLHNRQQTTMDTKTAPLKNKPFNLSQVQKSTTLHIDYTGNLPEIGSGGTRLFLISWSWWGRYIHLQPLKNLRDEATTTTLKECLDFWRGHQIVIESIRLDN
jgi:hypothetical protein